VGYTFVFGKQVYTIREVGFCRLDAITVRQPTVSKPWQFDTVLHDIYIVCQGHDMSVSLAEDGVEVSIVWCQGHDMSVSLAKDGVEVSIVWCQGHDMSLSLAKDGVEVTLISDAAVFAMMSRVNKVIVGTHAVMADGGLKAVSGSHAIALAAKYYSVPVCTETRLNRFYLTCSYC